MMIDVDGPDVRAFGCELTAEEIINTVHAHPTLSEAVHEATLATEGRTLNF